MRIFFALVPAVMFFSYSQAQKNKGSAQTRATDLTKTWLIRTSPFALFEPTTTLMTGAEYRIKDALAVGFNLGYIFNDQITLFNQQSANGIVFRPGIKFYPGEKKSFYVEGELMYRFTNYNMQDWVDRNCQNATGTFQELRNFKLRKNVYGGHINFGFLKPLNRRAGNNMFIDTYLGFGLRKKVFTNKGLPDDACYQRRRVWLFGDGNDDQLSSIRLGARLLWRL